MEKLKHSDHFHGSDLEKIEKLYGIRKEEIISFSANVNPLGISQALRQTLSENLDAVSSYPDREYTSLKDAISRYCDIPAENIIVGNGSTELISIIISLKHPSRAMILGPSYSEYEREIIQNGGTSMYFPLRERDGFRLDLEKLEKELKSDIGMLIICNPNNPTSTCISREELRSILDICKTKGIFVMVDETYIEFTPDQKSVEGIPLSEWYSNLFIIRGISKFFAAPGLRLGYGITGNTDLIHEINTRKNPWTINSLAEVAGKVMFSDRDYIEKTRNLIFSERSRVCSKLDEMEKRGLLHYFTPMANFVLCRIDNGMNAQFLFDECIRQRMMIRNCAAFPFLDERYFRFCFMKKEDNDALLECIDRTLSGKNGMVK